MDGGFFDPPLADNRMIGEHRYKMPMKEVAIGVLIAVLLIYGSAIAQPNIQPVTSSGEELFGLEAFDQAMLVLMAENYLPSGTLAVAYQGRLVLAKGYGFASKGFMKSEPMQPKYRLRIASLSKPITAVAVMLLVASDRLTLDDPVLGVLGNTAPAAKDLRDSRVERITVRQLLEHHGGWDREKSQDPMFETAPLCPSQTRRFLETTMLDFTPGGRYAYSNVGYCLLGSIIENVSGEPYADFIKKAIAAPLNIKSFELASRQGSLPGEGEYFGSRFPGGRIYNALRRISHRSNGRARRVGNNRGGLLAFLERFGWYS